VNGAGLLAGVRGFWERHWIEIVWALVFAVVFAVGADLLQVGSRLRAGIRHIKNRAAEQSIKQLKQRIKELGNYRDGLAKYLSSDKALYLATLRIVMGVLLCVCMGEILVVFGNVKTLARVVQFKDVDMGMFQLFAICFFAMGVFFVIQGGKLASLDSQTKISEQIAKIEGEIANLQTVLDRQTQARDSMTSSSE